jgi:predicted RNase H-like HicB family nuclease
VVVSTYAIIIERGDDGGFGAWSPDVPGCVALGDTEAETLAEMEEAIRLHLDVLRERQESLPVSATVSATTIEAA